MGERESIGLGAREEGEEMERKRKNWIGRERKGRGRNRVNEGESGVGKFVS